MTLEVKLFAKDARVKLWARLEGQKAVDMPTGEQQLEDRFKRGSRRGIYRVQGNVREHVEGNLLQMRRHVYDEEGEVRPSKQS